MPDTCRRMNAHAENFRQEMSEFASQRRQVIDQIASLRARALRVSLVGHLIHLSPPDPNQVGMNDQAKQTLLREQVDAFARVLSWMHGKDSAGTVNQDILDWVSKVAIRHGKIRRVISQMLDLSREISEAQQKNNSDGNDATSKLQSVWARHFEFTQNEFFASVTEFCDDLWTDIENSQKADIENAAEVSKTIAETLSKLERIGKHVKLVSINAAVEASRAGDTGKGLTVIAVEFKSLAEEIQSLAADASLRIKDV